MDIPDIRNILDSTIPPETAAPILADKGFSDPLKAVRNLRMLASSEGSRFAGILEPLLKALSSCADPDLALNNLERYASSFADRDALFAALETDRKLLWTLSVLMGSSQFLATWLCNLPEYTLGLLTDAAFIDRQPDRAELIEELQKMLEGCGSRASVAAGPVLRRFKKRETLRIALRDLLGKADVDETATAVATLAEALLEGAHDVCRGELVARYGRPLYTDDNGEVKESGFVVMGMGKLGGTELNFSSDIDPIYVYTSEKGETTGAGDSGGNSISNHQFFIKLAELLTRVISDVTEDGFVYRVDLRLRPEGQRGDITSSLRSHEVYYESWGETWERSAMIKAWPVAGDMELGKAFVKMIRPFVYRKYLDYSAIEEIKAMKDRIDRHETAKGRKGLDVKLGRGGIREVEFFIQALQLLYGGRIPAIRERKSLKALHKLAQKGLITYDEYSQLSAAYRFLRTAEHRLQLFNDRQTHTLPSDLKELELFSRRMGYRPRRNESAADLFMKDYRQYTEQVRTTFEELFRTARHEESYAGYAALLDPSLTYEEVKGTLEKFGFTDPFKAYRNITLLRDGDPFSHQTFRSRKAFYDLFDHLMTCLKGLPDPDQALNNFEAFVSGMGARGTLYTLLSANPKALDPILTLFSNSEYLSRILISRPEIVEPMLRYNLAVPFRSRMGLSAELTSMTGAQPDVASRIDALRRFKNLEEIRLGLRDLMGDSSAPLSKGLSQGLTRLAEVCLEEALRLALQEMEARYGTPVDGGFCVVGMGKLGGRELSYGSDLDIIFLYDGGLHDGEGETSGGAGGSLGHQEFFSKIAHRLMSHLSTLTREGIAYRVDARLRPGGSKGPLATSVNAMRRYFMEEGGADIWERQALLKARVVAGNRAMENDLRVIITGSVARAAASPDIAAAVRNMRRRMEEERCGHGKGYNIKVGRGGIVDIEFLAQYLQLRHGASCPAIVTPSTVNALRLMEKHGLLPKESAAILLEGYQFLRKLEKRIRITGITSSVVPLAQSDKMKALARRMGYGGPDGTTQLMEDYLATADRVRSLFDELVR